MMWPRDSHDMRLLATRLVITPQPSALDGCTTSSATRSLLRLLAVPRNNRFESEIELEHFESSEPDCRIEPYAETYPFSYSADEIPDLNRSIERSYPDPDHQVDLWAKRFLEGGSGKNTLALLTAMTRAIKENFYYAARMEEGCQNPSETLQSGRGSCRDFALLMIEAVRSLGFAARFISGYIFVSAAGNWGNVGGGATHAWLEIYLPGAGWMEFDPTNGIVGNRDLIRVAVVRDPAQAIPISGTWTGAPNDFQGLEVDVKVSSIAT